MPEPAPELTMQELLALGINAFALQLLVESLPNLDVLETVKTLSFRFRGARITIEFDGTMDRRHH